MEERFNPANKALKAVMNGDAGRFLGLEKRQNAVLDVMKKQKIAADPGKLANYKKKEFLSSIDKEKDLGFYAKKALHEVYGEKRVVREIPKTAVEASVPTRGKTYDEIISKRKNSESRLSEANLATKNIKVLDLGISSKNVRAASNLLATANKEVNESRELQHFQASTENNNVKDILKRIQN